MDRLLLGLTGSARANEPLGTTTLELEAMAADLKLTQRAGFMGVFDRTFSFPTLDRPACAVVNTDLQEQGGTHWLGLAWLPSSKTVTLFDPFGFSEEGLLKNYHFSIGQILRKTVETQKGYGGGRCITLEKNTKAVQCPCSTTCGLYALYFCESFARYPTRPLENSFIDALRDVRLFSREGPVPKVHPDLKKCGHQNHRVLLAWIRSQSPYYRRHEARLEKSVRLFALPEHEPALVKSY